MALWSNKIKVHKNCTQMFFRAVPSIESRNEHPRCVIRIKTTPDFTPGYISVCDQNDQNTWYGNKDGHRRGTKLVSRRDYVKET